MTPEERERWDRSKYGQAARDLRTRGSDHEAQCIDELGTRVHRAERLAEIRGRMLQGDLAVLRAAAAVLVVSAERLAVEGEVSESNPEGT